MNKAAVESAQLGKKPLSFNSAARVEESLLCNFLTQLLPNQQVVLSFSQPQGTWGPIPAQHLKMKRRGLSVLLSLHL